jgi:uncharacterized protein YjiS (DUF1127 family)
MTPATVNHQGLPDMSAHVAKDEIALMMPERLAHYFQDETDYSQVTETKSGGLLAAIGAVVRWFAEMPRRHAVIDELSSLSDHELSDIGLHRADLSQVFDSRFVAERNAERDALAARRAVAV